LEDWLSRRCDPKFGRRVRQTSGFILALRGADGPCPTPNAIALSLGPMATHLSDVISCSRAMAFACMT
jgi:hypothetical protein